MSRFPNPDIRRPGFISGTCPNLRFEALNTMPKGLTSEHRASGIGSTGANQIENPGRAWGSTLVLVAMLGFSSFSPASSSEASSSGAGRLTATLSEAFPSTAWPYLLKTKELQEKENKKVLNPLDRAVSPHHRGRSRDRAWLWVGFSRDSKADSKFFNFILEPSPNPVSKFFLLPAWTGRGH